MKADETLALLSGRDMLDRLYGFAYRRCSSCHEAEDLCSEIVLAVLRAIRRGGEINDFHAYVWSVAHRVYADYCEARGKSRAAVCGAELSDGIVNTQANPIEEYLEAKDDEDRLRRITREISFLSKIYRDVMVMYYLDGRKTAEIASALGISETAVKQRLFSARNKVKKEVDRMDTRNLTLKPVQFICQGDGDPVKSNPFKNTSRSFSQNVLYLCRDTERSARDISEALNVPLPFVEEELEIQRHGTNGSDGMLKKLDSGKYISTFIMLDYADYKEIRALLSSRLEAFTDRLERYIEGKREQILSFPFLSRQDDIRFILWSLVNRMCWHMGGELSNSVERKFYPDIKHDVKDYYPFAFIVYPGEEYSINFVGCDGVDGYSVGGYSSVHLCNIYDGYRKEAHFHCGLNISTTPYILLTLRSIGGLDINALTGDEKETAAKAIENGFLRKENGSLAPHILVFDMEALNDFYALANGFAAEVRDFADGLAGDFNAMIRKYLPGHLYGQVDKFISHTTVGFESDVIDKCIERGILYKPDRLICPEGTFMAVKK